MEQKSPGAKSDAGNLRRRSDPAKGVDVSLSFLDSIYRRAGMVDSIMNPAMGRLLDGLSLSFPDPQMVDAIRRQAQLYENIRGPLVTVLASPAPLVQFAQVGAQLSAQIQASLDPLFVSINRVLSDAFLPIRELAERIGEVSRVGEAFRHYNLWLAPSMSEVLVAKIVSLYESGAGSGTVHSVVSRYYAKYNWQQLQEVLERCRSNSLFERRIKVIEEALRAHREGLYNLTVPGLLIHLEGIAADYVRKNKLLPQIRGQTKEIIVTALENTPYSLLDIKTYAGVGALIEYVKDSMFASVDFDKEHVRLHGENKLYGHAVRHGRQIAFGSRMNSLRLFLFLDVMALLED